MMKDDISGGGVMTEWNGIKVGGLYKRTGPRSRGAPLLMVVEIKQTYFKPADIHPISGKELEQERAHADVMMMVNGRSGVVELRTGNARYKGVRWTVPGTATGWNGYGQEEVWPYKEVV